MSRDTHTARFLQNTLSTALYHITAMVMGFLTPRLMILYYGSEVNGLIVSVTEFLTYFKTVEAGLAAAAIAALYEPLAKRDASAISGVVSAARGFYNRAGWIFAALTLAFSAVYPFIVPVMDANGLRMNELSVMLLVLAMGVSGVLEFFSLSRYRVLLTADQRTYVVSLTSMCSLLLSTALLVALPILGADVITVRLAASLTILVRSVLLHRYTHKHYPDVNVYAPPNKTALSKRWDALSVELTDVFQQGAGVVLTTLITRDAGIVSVYGLYHMVTVGLWSILKMGTTGVYSIFGNLLVSGRKSRFQTAYRDFECLYHTVCGVLFGAAAVLIIPFVNLYTENVTDVNYNQPIIGLLIIAEALSNQIKIPLDLMISSSGKFTEVRWHCVAQVVTTAVLGTLLGLLGLSLYGVTGAVCGALLGVIGGNLVRAGFQLSFVPKHVTGLDWRESLWRMLRMVLTVALVAAPLLALIQPPRRFFTWVLYAALLAIYATAVSGALAWLFDRKAFKSLIGRVAYMFKHGRSRES